jgi:catechol 2,3-dioxygenase-like lactoylglutathione lyase family enzyme
MKLELVPIPVADVDRAKAFYVEKLGFVEDVDVRPRTVSGGAGDAAGLGVLDRHGHRSAGLRRHDARRDQGLHLVVADIEQARADLRGRGVDVGEVVDVGGGVKYAWLTDPDGNTLTLQEMAWRTGDAF